MSNTCSKIIIHHSLTKDSKTKSWDAIRDYHVNHQGWNDIGYHYGIELVGNEYKIFKGRDESKGGAHTKGQNMKSIGICCVGNYDIETPPEGMLYKLIELIDDISTRHGKLPIFSHNTFASYKSCPGKKFPMTWVINHAYGTLSEWAEVVNKLHKAGIVSSPDYWITSDSYNIEWFKKLINNFAKQDSFEADIKWMHLKGIINSPKYWLNNKTYNMDNCKAMIKKISMFV